MSYSTHVSNPEIILIGSGVMSANLGAMLKRLNPAFSIQVYELSSELAHESSDGWNNAGTGHAGICELSYTPKREADGTVNVRKVIDIFEQFEHSRQFWGYAAASGMIENPREFINPVPHLSFVHGQEMVEFLHARYEGMSAHHFFESMEFSTDRDVIGEWAPLLTEERGKEPIAVTHMEGGTDVNFGVVSRKLLHWLSEQKDCGIATGHRVIGLTKLAAGGWQIRVKNLETGKIFTNQAMFIFVGAGGGSLSLLQKAGIPEAIGMGGFPIGGQWLVCDNPEVVGRHLAKVYGQPLPAAPTMAVPHLDTRVLNGKKHLLFGPFAAWTTKFLHTGGSFLDLPFSVRPGNLLTLLNIGVSNLSLVRYLIQQGTQSMSDRLDVLRIFYPGARAADWTLKDAGIRVQTIKKSDGKAGIVHYGTEIITSADKSISALMGASPGASVSVDIALNVVKKCFPGLLSSSDGKAMMDEMIPGWDEDLSDPANANRFRDISCRATENLQLQPAPVSVLITARPSKTEVKSRP
ncbi:MAG: malate dehydrogenase (quinone) [Candidatus Methylacidiphilales bacterium]|nr:malate dehydrogenase (quinone) [Candidatus Methylacidiphilales bacterium]